MCVGAGPISSENSTCCRMKSDRVGSVLSQHKTCIDARPAGPVLFTGPGSTGHSDVHAGFPRRWENSTAVIRNISAKCTVCIIYSQTTLKLYNTIGHLWWRDATFITAKNRPPEKTSMVAGKRLGLCRAGGGSLPSFRYRHAPTGICDDVHGNGGRAQGSAADRRFLERKPGRPHAIRRAGK